MIRSTPLPVIQQAGSVLKTMLVAVLVMTMVSFLSLMSYFILLQTSFEWQERLESELTIQVVPLSSLRIEEQIEKTEQILRQYPGIRAVKRFSKEEEMALLEPWLGKDPILSELPLPKMIAVLLSSPQTFSIPDLEELLRKEGQGALVQSHHPWSQKIGHFIWVLEKMMALVLLFLGGCLVAVTAFSCRNVIVAARETIDLLYLCGATDDFVAHHLAIGLLKTAVWASILGMFGGGIFLFIFSCLEYWVAQSSVLETFGNLLMPSSPYAKAVYISLFALPGLVIVLCVVSTRATLKWVLEHEGKISRLESLSL